MPATLVITRPFRPIVESFGSTLGVIDYPTVAVEHPISFKSADELALVAASIVDSVFENLTQKTTMPRPS